MISPLICFKCGCQDKRIKPIIEGMFEAVFRCESCDTAWRITQVVTGDNMGADE